MRCNGATERESWKMAKVREVGEIYRCEVCGNVVDVREVGGGELVCCDEPMILEEETDTTEE